MEEEEEWGRPYTFLPQINGRTELSPGEAEDFWKMRFWVGEIWNSRTKF